jgi:CheY-like chemotaxis protein
MKAAKEICPLEETGGYIMFITPSTETQKKSGNRTVVIAGGKTRDMLSLSLLLQRFAYTVHSAHTAAQALELVSSARPALVIADTVLEGANRTDLLHQLLYKDRAVSSIPVVYLVFPSDAAMEQKCLHYGAAGCISKPIQAEELFQAVQAAIEPKPRADIRIDTRLPVSLDNVQLECPEGEDGCTIDLSEHGMHVPMSEPYPRNRRLMVRIRIKDRTISAEGSVMYSHYSRAGFNRKPGMGLKFISIAPQDQEFIRKFVRDEVMLDVTAALIRAEQTL